MDIKATFTHDYEDSVTAVILQDAWLCDISNTGSKLNADARAISDINMSTSFGITMLTTLNLPLDLSNLYLFLQTCGGISSTFAIGALAKAKFNSNEFNLASLPFPGASFTIPKLFSVSPKFDLKAQAAPDMELDGHFETRIDIASWDVQQP